MYPRILLENILLILLFFQILKKKMKKSIVLSNAKRKIGRMEDINERIIEDFLEQVLVSGLMVLKDYFLEKLKKEAKFFLRKYQIFQKFISE